MKVKAAIIFIILIIFSLKISFPVDNSLYTVPLERFSDKIYTERISKYRIKSTNEFILPNTQYQRILGKSLLKNIYSIVLQTGDIESNNADKINSFENFLSNTRLLNLDEPEIIKLKQKFENSSDILKDVERFVDNHISNKTIGIPIISAHEILKNKSGDCTEHTVLAVSIIRSLRIPCRALVGMLLSEDFEGNKNVFVYHMWAEAYINGRWMLVDATNPGQKHANRYIAFSYHHLQTQMPLSYLKAVSAMKNFTVEYIK